MKYTWSVICTKCGAAAPSSAVDELKCQSWAASHTCSAVDS